MSGNDQHKVQSSNLVTLTSSSPPSQSTTCAVGSSSLTAAAATSSPLESAAPAPASSSRMKRPLSSNGHHSPSQITEDLHDQLGLTDHLESKDEFAEEEDQHDHLVNNSNNNNNNCTDHDSMGPPLKRHKLGANNNLGPGGGNYRGGMHDNGHDDDDDDGPMSPNIEARFLVSSRDAGAIIGRGGSNITHLRQSYDSSITVPDCPSPERVLTIVANIDRICKIIREVLKYIDTRPHALGTASGRFDSGGPGLSNKLIRSPRSVVGGSSLGGYDTRGELKDKSVATEIRLLLHTSHAGGLIGKGGLRITQLREETHAGIKVYSECAPQSSERICVIYGQLEIVVHAVRSILYLITGFPMKGPNMAYDPRHYDQYLSPMYGGFSDPSSVLPGGSGGTGSSLTAPPPTSALHSGHHSGSGGSGGGGPSQRNPYFQSASIPPPPPTLAAASLVAAASRQRSSGRNQYPISTLTSHSGGSGYHGHHQNHHHHQSGLMSPLNGPTRGYKGSALMDDPQNDLFSPDFGATFSGDAVSTIPWSSARSYGSSRRSSASGGGGVAGLDLFSPIGQDIDWLNYPSAAAKSWQSGGGLASSHSSLLHQLLSREDVNISSNIDGTASATISVPNKTVGAIIGRGGSRISEIRQKSRADISIGQLNKSASVNRLITVKGFLGEVQNACVLIVKCIDENE